MDIAPVHIRRFPSLRCHRFHRVLDVYHGHKTIQQQQQQMYTFAEDDQFDHSAS